MKKLIIFLVIFNFLRATSQVDLGVDVFFNEKRESIIKDKKIALVINQTSVNKDLKPTLELFLENQKDYKLVKIFSPEHGINGTHHAGETVQDSKLKDIKVFSLHGKNKRASAEMLKDVDVIFFDIQEIGSRSYTYATTLFYLIEESAKNNVK